MHQLIREDTRPSVTTRFFRTNPDSGIDVQALFVEHGVARQESLSENGLVRTVTMSFADTARWEALVTSQDFINCVLNPQIAYNLQHGIESRVYYNQTEQP